MDRRCVVIHRDSSLIPRFLIYLVRRIFSSVSADGVQVLVSDVYLADLTSLPCTPYLCNQGSPTLFPPLACKSLSQGSPASFLILPVPLTSLTRVHLHGIPLTLLLTSCTQSLPALFPLCLQISVPGFTCIILDLPVPLTCTQSSPALYSIDITFLPLYPEFTCLACHLLW